MINTVRSHAGRAVAALGLLSVLGACTPAPAAPPAPPAPPKYLFEFNRTNEPTAAFFQSNGFGGGGGSNGILSGQLGTDVTTSVSGTVTVDCTGLSGSDVQVALLVRHNATPTGFSGYADDYSFSGACNSEIPVSIPSTAFVGTDSFWLIPKQQTAFGMIYPTPVGTVTTFAIHSDALVPATISL